MYKKKPITFGRINLGALMTWQDYVKRKKRWYSSFIDSSIDIMVFACICSILISIAVSSVWFVLSRVVG